MKNVVETLFSQIANRVVLPVLRRYGSTDMDFYPFI